MKNILLTFRRIKTNGTASTLGIAGLVVGLVCVVYIFFWIIEQTSYDQFHKKLDRIFVVHAFLGEGPEKVNFQGCPPAVGLALKEEYPEVENTARFFPPYQEFLFGFGEHKYMEKTAFSDFTLFDIFSYTFVFGDKGDSSNPNRVILTQSVAEKYFGNSDPVGKLIKFDFHTDLTVAGVVKDNSGKSTITFDAILPLEIMGNHGFFKNSRSDFLTSWYNNAFTTYGLLVNPGGYKKVESTISRRIQKVKPESTNYLRLYKFKDGYLYEQNNIRSVRLFGMIALLVLLAAVTNFINLSTIRSFKQAKETGLRKTLGASKINLAVLVYSEIATICFLTFIAAIVLALIGLPLFNEIIGHSIDYSILFSWKPIITLILIYLLTVLLAGSYPAFFITKFLAIETLNSNFQTVKGKSLFRNSLVAVIFVVSIALLSSTFVISKQTNFMSQMDLGFNKEQLMYLDLKGNLRDQCIALKGELERSSNVFSATIVSNLPSIIGNNSEGLNWAGKDPEFKPLVTFWEADEGLLETLGAQMIEGNFFNKNQDGIIINKTFADMIGWDSFDGKNLNDDGNQLRILGVIKDIRFNSLSIETKPMVITKSVGPNNYMILKVNTAQIENLLKYIQNTCKTIEPDIPVKYGFLDDEYAKMLISETNLSKLTGIFSGFAMIVLCLGLLGFVMFMAEQKTKEIGIRKSLGEGVESIVGKFIKPFLITGLLAGVIAVPLMWYLMDRWLQSYAYRIQLNIWIFLVAVIFVIGVAVLTVSWQSWKAATRNPVEALRYE